MAQTFAKLQTEKNTMKNDMSDLFAVEIYNIKYATVGVYFNNEFIYLKNHFGDFEALSIIEEQSNIKVVSNSKKIIQNFKALLIFCMQFLSKSCNAEKAKKVNNNFIKVIT